MVANPGTPESPGGLLPLNLPRPVAVKTDAPGEPVAVLLRGQLRAVLGISDRWRIDDEWWRGEVSRAYFALELEGEMRLTIYQDLVTGAWHQQQYTPPARLQTS